MNKRILIDFIILFLSYLTSTYLKDEPFDVVFKKYLFLFAIYVVIYLLVSFISKKSRQIIYKNNRILLTSFFSNWAVSTLIFLSLIYVFEIDFPSRFVILGYIFTFLCIKTASLLLVMSYKHALIIVNKEDVEHIQTINSVLNTATNNIQKNKINLEETNSIFNLINEEFGQDVVDYINFHIRENKNETDYHFSTNRFNILKIPYLSKNIVNFSNLNDKKKINKYIEAISIKLEFSGYFICCAITNDTRKDNFLKKFPIVLNYILYSFYFIYKRIWPKLPYFKRIYFYITGGRDRALSHAEVLGRLYSCGFEYVDHKIIEKKTWYITKKTSNPILDYDPTYGPLIRLKRVGKNGKIFNVFKLRTMHPYSEYIQEFVFKTNNFDDNCKFKDDFRISTLGKFCRKYWLDELPMIYNLLKGDMKIVGVRPLSKHFFELYPKETQELRIRNKPGLFPPFYVDMPSNFDEVVASEKKYLELYQKHKLKTDITYFFKIAKNIIFKNARSK